VGLVFTDLDPFQLEKRIYSCKTTASAKPGQITPVDIVVEEGDTGLPAGPVIGEIQHAGIKAKIDGGKIVIMQKSVVAKAGEEVPEEAAPVLKRLGIEPIEISLELKGVFDGKTVYTAEVLHIDSTEVFNQFTQAHQKAFNLAYNVGYFTKDTLPLLLQKAFIESVNLALNAEIINKETLPTFLVKADTQAKALKALIPEEIKETEKKEAKPEEPAKEEKAKKTETKETEPEDKKEEKVKDKAEEKAVDEAKPEDVESKTEKTEKSVKEKKEEPKKEESQAE
jgi:large subunit ribosomal protein L10